ncbi:MAG: hypothetical protein U5N58_03735 [Actinomycetota bacterium]|nr:hypothetical protein [Actinomycetota bacterium]
MLQSITGENFNQSLSVQLGQAIGTYQEGSKEYIRASGEGENISLYYQAGFSGDEVLVTVVMDTEDEGYIITGLWFDSSQFKKIIK